MAPRALVIGGSGATGAHVVAGLANRGYEVVILHRGVHESPALAGYRHIHADPHFAPGLQKAVAEEFYDVVVAMYGRLRIIADVFAGRCERFVSVGGTPIYAGMLDPGSIRPTGMALLAREESALADPSTIADSRTANFAEKLLAAEQAVLEHHRNGRYWATHVRYPTIYGPASPRPHEWSVVNRVLDGRRTILLPDGGLAVWSRCAAPNAAHCLLLALENERAGGQVFNCADDDVYSVRQWVELIGQTMDVELSFVDVPAPLHWLVSHFMLGKGHGSAHSLIDISKAREILGYRDVVSAPDATAETVTHLQREPPSAAQLEMLDDRFRYDLEDAVAARLDQLGDEFSPSAWSSELVHTYAHPRAPANAPDHRGR